MRIVKKCFYSCLFICLTLSFYTLYAQTGTITIKGKVGDSITRAVLTDASLSLLHLSDSMVVRRSVSGKNGFLFNHLKAGQYQLYVSNIGYRDTILNISLKAADTVYNTGAIWLQPTVHSLVEVVVKAIIPPVIAKNDTVVYNVSAFKTRPNATVEELLKKLPGIQVDKDGNITMQGEKIQKVFVDGKVFFLNDPKLATQNLLADMVDKVEAFNEKSERAKLTGIPDQNPGKVLNLRLKPDRKKGLFGSVEKAVATQNRYGIKASANYFKEDTYLSATGNNSNGGNLQGGGGTLNNRVNDFSLNYRSNITEKLELTASYRGTGNNLNNNVYNQRQTFLQDSSLLQGREMARYDKQQNHTMTAFVQYALDSFSTISSNASFNMQENGKRSNDNTATEVIKSFTFRTANDAFTDINRTDKSWNGTFSLNYNHRFKKQGRFIGLGVNKGNSQSKGQSALESLTRFYNGNGFITDSLARDQLSFQRGNSQSYEFNITYTEPIAKGQVLDFSYSLSNGSSKSRQETFNYNRVTGKYDELDTISSNNFKSGNNNQQVAIGYNYFRKKLQWQAGIAMARNTQLNRDVSGHQMDINQSITNIFPRASLIYSISKQKNLQVNYNGRNRPPSIQELQPLPDYTNPLLIRLGNPNLKQEFTNEIRLNYKDFSARKNRSLFGQLEFNNNAHKIVNATRINGQGAQEQQSVNLEGNYSIGTNIDYSFSYGNDVNKGNIAINTNVRYDNAVNLVNADKNVRKTFNWRQAMRVDYYIKEKFTTSVSARFNGNWSDYSIDAGKTSTLFWHDYNASFYYELPWQCSVSSDINIIINVAQQNLAGTQAAVWNASLIKRLFKNQTGEVKLSAFDILNKGNNFSQYTGDNFIETTRTEVLKRVVVLSFKYNFRKNNL